jgi:hypothetical protein
MTSEVADRFCFWVLNPLTLVVEVADGMNYICKNSCNINIVTCFAY